MRGDNNWLKSYGEPGKQSVFNAPGTGGFQVDPSIQVNTKEDLYKTRMDALIEGTQKRADAVLKAVKDVSNLSQSSPPAENNNTYDFGSGNKNYGGSGDWGPCTANNLPTCKDSHWYPSSIQVQTYDEDEKTFIFGRPDNWSVMKFDALYIKGGKNVLRFYPGVYYFLSLKIEGNQNKIYLDTTQGPVYIFVESINVKWSNPPWEGGFTIKGNNNALVVYKDTDLLGGPITKYEDKVDANGDFNTIGPSGRKVAEVFIGHKYSDKEFYIEGNGNLIGGFAAGPGGGLSSPLSAPAIGNSNTASSNGSEVYQNGEQMEFLSAVVDALSVTSETFRMWGRYRAEINIKGNVNYLAGGYLFLNCGYHTYEFLVQGNNNTFFGAFSIEGKFLVGNQGGGNASNNIFFLDNRFYPFPMVPYKKTMHLQYKRRL